MPRITGRFVAHIDAPFVQQVVDVAKRKRGTDVEDHRKTDDLGIGLEELERDALGHAGSLRNHPIAAQSTFF